jgi:hypothetical protein
LCSNSGCGNDLFNEAQFCDDTGDCSKDSICCSDYRLIFKSYCSTSCPLENRACRTDLDCTDERPDCDDGVCRELPPPDAGMP